MSKRQGTSEREESLEARRAGPGTVHHSTRWSSIGRGGQQGIRFLSSLVIFRLLGPDQVGLMQMVLVVTGFLDQFRDVGTGLAIVQRKEIDPAFVSSMFVLNFLIGTGLTCLLVLGAGPIAVAFGEARLMPILRVVGPVFAVTCLGLVHRSLLRRELKFESLAWVDITNAVTYGVVSIVLACMGFRVWSLVWGYLVANLLTTITLWIQSSWKPRLIFDVGHWREYKSFCTNILGFSLVNWVLSNFDRIIVGRMLGASALGLYGFAFFLTMFPVRTITSVLIAVLVPSLARLQDHDAKFREKYVRACAGIALVTFPMMFGVASVAEPLVTSLWGGTWSAAVPIIMLLTPVAVMDSIGKTTGSLFIAKGRADLMFRCALGFGIVTVASLSIGAHWGIEGVAAAYAVSASILIFFRLAIPFRLVSLPVSTLAKTLAPYLAAGLIMFLVVRAARTWALSGVHDPRLVLIVSVLVGALVYGGWVGWARPLSMHDLRAVLVGRRGR